MDTAARPATSEGIRNVISIVLTIIVTNYSSFLKEAL